MSGEHSVAATAASISTGMSSELDVATYVIDGDAMANSSPTLLQAPVASIFTKKASHDPDHPTTVSPAGVVIRSDINIEGPVNCSVKCLDSDIFVPASAHVPGIALTSSPAPTLVFLDILTPATSSSASLMDATQCAL